jgi:hypothetical protein
MRKTPPVLLLLCTLVMAGAAGAAGAPNGGAHGDATFAPALNCGDHGEQAFARGVAGESLIRAAAVRADEPIASHWPAPDPRDTGLEAFARCRIWDGGILAAASATST